MIIIKVPTIRKHNMIHMLVSRYSDVNSNSRAMGVGSLGLVSSSDLLPTTIAVLRQINIKHQTELLDFEPEVDDLEQYLRDTPWNNEVDSSLNDSLPTIEGSEILQAQLKALCVEFKDIFSTEVRAEPADIPPFAIKVDVEKWKVPANRTPPRPQTMAKQYGTAIQIEKMLKLNVIRKSQSAEHSQVLVGVVATRTKAVVIFFKVIILTFFKKKCY